MPIYLRENCVNVVSPREPRVLESARLHEKALVGVNDELIPHFESGNNVPLIEKKHCNRELRE